MTKKLTGALVIFAKTIGLSPVKTRLAAGIGKEKAERFYQLSLKAVEEIALVVQEESKNQITPYWAIAEKEGVASEMWQNLDPIWTGEGDLGQRLDYVYRALMAKHDYVMMIGSDSPQLSPEAILDAAVKLQSEKNGCVIGPCDDGGFYLFGGNSEIESEIWTRVVYSKSDTLKQLEENLSDYPLKYLDKEHDVDVMDDLSMLKKTLLEKDNLLMTQKALMDFLDH